jgi:hypothetical protein
VQVQKEVYYMTAAVHKYPHLADPAIYKTDRSGTDRHQSAAFLFNCQKEFQSPGEQISGR